MILATSILCQTSSMTCKHTVVPSQMRLITNTRFLSAKSDKISGELFVQITDLLLTAYHPRMYPSRRYIRADLTPTPSSTRDGSFYLKRIKKQIPTRIFKFLADIDKTRSLAPASVLNQSTHPGQLLHML